MARSLSRLARRRMGGGGASRPIPWRALRRPLTGLAPSRLATRSAHTRMASSPTSIGSQSQACFKAFLVPGYVAADHPQQSSKRKPLEDATVSGAKCRQRSASTRDGIITKYKQDLQAAWMHEQTTLQPWFQPVALELNCRRLDPENLPSGFTRTGRTDTSTTLQIPRPLKASGFAQRLTECPF